MEVKQPEHQTEILANLLLNPFNKFCVDCTKNESTHCNVSYGTFICETCASIHLDAFGMDKSYVKSIFHDLWDSYQMKIVTVGGNQPFWDFLKEYQSEQKPLLTKYHTSEAGYYKRRLAALAIEKPFTEKAPAKNFDEILDRGLETGKSVAKQGEALVNKMGDALDAKISKWFKK